MSEIKQGDPVKVHYTGRLEDGTVFDASEANVPLEFTAGGDEIIPGFSQAVIGMKPGDTKTVTIPPDQGFGPRVDNQGQRVDRELLPPDVFVGSTLQAESQEGEEPFTVWVTELDEETAVLNVNHPLAGHTLTFDIELVAPGG